MGIHTWRVDDMIMVNVDDLSRERIRGAVKILPINSWWTVTFVASKNADIIGAVLLCSANSSSTPSRAFFANVVDNKARRAGRKL